MELPCPNCGAKRFSPQATLCVSCGANPVYQTAVGDLRLVWLYDKVEPPKICLTCSVDTELSNVEFRQSADERKTTFGEVLLSFFFLFRFKKFLRVYENAVNSTGDMIDVEIFQCSCCRERYRPRIEFSDLPNKRLLIYASEDFIKEANSHEF